MNKLIKFNATYTIIGGEYRVWCESHCGLHFFFLTAPNYDSAYMQADMTCEYKGGRLERFSKDA